MKDRYFKYSALSIFTCLMAVGCSDVVNMDEGWDDDLSASGAPVVTRITASADTATTITSASLDQSIAVFGDNLAHVQQVRVNDVELDLSQVYAKRHRLEIVIPRVLPVEITNTLYIKTKLGDITVPLNVKLPNLELKGFSNEFAMNGDTVQIVGANFDLYKIDSINAVVQFNGKKILPFSCYEKVISIEIPEDAPLNTTSYLTISSPATTFEVKIPFRETGIPILSDDPRTQSNDMWYASGFTDVTPDSDPEAPMFKRYLNFKKNYPGSWGYENILMSYFWLDENAADMLDNPENYWVKFELLNPIEVPMARYLRIGTIESEGENLMYMWDPTATNGGVSLNTMGKWQTVALEVTNVFPAKGGNKTNLRLAKEPYVNTNERNGFKLAMQREMAGDSEFYLWNIRFVKKYQTVYSPE